jgi:uncharacterized membrane protein
VRIPSILRQDQSRTVHIGIAAVVGVAAAVVVGTTAGWKYAPAAGWIATAAVVGFLSVIASWLAVQVVYTLRYAVLYYTEPLGVDFNQDDKPTFADLGSRRCSKRWCRICSGR